MLWLHDWYVATKSFVILGHKKLLREDGLFLPMLDDILLVYLRMLSA